MVKKIAWNIFCLFIGSWTHTSNFGAQLRKNIVIQRTWKLKSYWTTQIKWMNKFISLLYNNVNKNLIMLRMIKKNKKGDRRHSEERQPYFLWQWLVSISHEKRFIIICMNLSQTTSLRDHHLIYSVTSFCVTVFASNLFILFWIKFSTHSSIKMFYGEERSMR